MRVALGAAVLLALAHPALALSCLPTDIARDFNAAANSDDTYVVVNGDLFFDDTKLPVTDFTNQATTPPTTDIAAWLDGYSLTANGFTRRFERDVVLRVSCVGPWCGHAEKGTYLTFLKQEGTTFVLPINACGGMSYMNPTPKQEAIVLRCMQGESCTSD